MKKIDELLKYGTKELAEVCERPRFESELLLAFDLQKERVWLHLHMDREAKIEHYADYIARRKDHEPLEYITNRVSFYGKDFHIERGVLIPRPETEILIDLANDYIGGRDLKVAEIGTGSGIISTVLAVLNSNLKIIGTDINPKAVELSRKNALAHGVAKQVEFRECSLLDCVKEGVDLLISNPPYIADSYALPKNVEYEPKEALFGGERGDELLQKIIDVWREREIPALFCEFGFDQKKYIQNYAQKFDGIKLEFYTDLAGLDRGFVLTR